MTLPSGADGLPVDMNHADITYTQPRGGFPLAAGGPVAVAQTVVALSDDERSIVDRLSAAVLSKRFGLQLRDAYYRGTVAVKDLGISIPPQMRQLHTAIGWPRVCIDALDERLDVQGFRYDDSTDVDLDLQGIWQANSLDSESQLAHMDALVFGYGYVAAGTSEDQSEPLITIESPLDIAVEWDPRARRMKHALRLYGPDQTRQATLYLPGQNVYLERHDGQWVVVERDEHNLGRVLLARLANRARSYDRTGASEITPEIMSITDAACRTLQGLEVAREFYSAPQRYFLGAQESAFQNPDGTPKSAVEVYLGRILALEADDEGNVPTVGQFTPYDPSTFTKVIDMYAKIVSSITGLPPHVLGYTTDNPASADAIRSAEMRLKLKADRKTRMFGESWRDVMKLALLVRDGTLPANADSITTVWADTATPTPAATTDSVFKQVQMGYLPATSDVTGEKLGYSPVERQRIEIDREKDQGDSMLNEIAAQLATKVDKTDTNLVKEANAPAALPMRPASGNAGG